MEGTADRVVDRWVVIAADDATVDRTDVVWGPRVEEVTAEDVEEARVDAGVVVDAILVDTRVVVDAILVDTGVVGTVGEDTAVVSPLADVCASDAVSSDVVCASDAVPSGDVDSDEAGFS